MPAGLNRLVSHRCEHLDQRDLGSTRLLFPYQVPAWSPSEGCSPWPAPHLSYDILYISKQYIPVPVLFLQCTLTLVPPTDGAHVPCPLMWQPMTIVEMMLYDFCLILFGALALGPQPPCDENTQAYASIGRGAPPTASARVSNCWIDFHASHHLTDTI